MQKLILENFQAPGDVLMLTAALRDLHRCHPDRFLTDVRTSCPDLWLHNPYLTPLDDDDWEVERIPCHYPLIHQSNERPCHFIHGFIHYLSERLGAPYMPMAFRGDIHLSEEEMARPSQVAEWTGESRPYWIMVAGGKYDFTIKWWSPRRWQQVVDLLEGEIRFVQVGESGHHHPELRGVIDLRGKTSLRELVLLVHHAAGVVCPVTALMHLAAAVPSADPNVSNRPCVVVAGGREPPHWEAYPFHQFLHTVGSLPCCQQGGCWRSRTAPIGDGDLKDRPRSRCLDVVDDLPRCMHMITPEDVVRAVRRYRPLAIESKPPVAPVPG